MQRINEKTAKRGSTVYQTRYTKLGAFSRLCVAQPVSFLGILVQRAGDLAVTDPTEPESATD